MEWYEDVVEGLKEFVDDIYRWDDPQLLLKRTVHKEDLAEEQTVQEKSLSYCI